MQFHLSCLPVAKNNFHSGFDNLQRAQNPQDLSVQSVEYVRMIKGYKMLDVGPVFRDNKIFYRLTDIV